MNLASLAAERRWHTIAVELAKLPDSPEKWLLTERLLETAHKVGERDGLRLAHSLVQGATP